MNVLVVGAAKTGTTIISKTIQGSLPHADFYMEPKDLAFFMSDSSAGSTAKVVKIIFEHWNLKPNLRKAIIANELPFRFDRTIMIVRDPRDEMLSRIMYFIYPWLVKNGYRGNEETIKNWLEFIEQVENSPVEYSFKQVVSFMNSNFGVSFFAATRALNVYRDFCEQMRDEVHLVRYEDFMLGNYTETEDYLGFPLVTENGLDHQYQRTRRSAGFDNWKPLFKQEDKEFFIKRLGGVMEKQGYTDWEFESASVLPSENYSGYLRRLIADYRTIEEVNESVSSSKKSFLDFLRK